MPQFIDTEKKICELFTQGTVFDYNGVRYTVSSSAAKPTTKKGECKTDVYIPTTFDGGEKVFKVSVKQTNADFLENKVTYQRAKEILGSDVDKILIKAIGGLKDKFNHTKLVYFDAGDHTKAKSIKLGWKFELLNVLSGNLSGKIDLTKEQKIDVYSGSNLPKEKKDASVGNSIVKESGVANYIMVVNPNVQWTVDYCIQQMQKIEDYVNGKEIYFACKALNYRATVNKWDGPRSLAVYVDWNIIDGKLHGKLIFDQPLQKKGAEMGEKLKSLLRTLKINASNFSSLKGLLADGVSYYVKESSR
jgi:hypothetical protein